MPQSIPLAELQVRLIAHTELTLADDAPFVSDADSGAALVEFAGRSIYQSWDKSVPATATNAGFLQHILQVGHLSILEHASATFHITGLAQSVAHELLRHRHLSVAQLSPRSAPDGFVLPTGITDDVRDQLTVELQRAGQAHAQLADRLLAAARTGVERKQARTAAAALLPAATATAVVATGNYRSWRHFVGSRATDAGDPGLRALAIAVLLHLQELSPAVFADFRISELPDGSKAAASPYVGEG